ncbi:MAG: DUF2892 domain-containing protein [Candidatus Micrarchaeia archaeon]
MKKNVGIIDRVFRVVFGIAFITGSLLFLTPPLSYPLMLLGAILIVTGLWGKCWVYKYLGIDTCGGICDIKRMPKAEKKEL